MNDQGPHIDQLRQEALRRLTVASQILDHLLGEHRRELTPAQVFALADTSKAVATALDALGRLQQPANLADGEEPAILRMASEIASAADAGDDGAPA